MNIENLEGEIWMVHPIYSNYAASNLGRVKSLGNDKNRKEKLIKPQLVNNGYLQFNACQNGKVVARPYVHRFVWECFHQEIIPKELEINHINEDKTDNRIFENLELCTHSENINYGTRNKRIAEAQSKQVGQYTLEGNLVKVWESTAECGRNGFNSGNISACCRNCYTPNSPNIYKHFKWKYIEDIMKMNNNNEYKFQD